MAKKKGFFGCVSKEEVMRKEKFANLHIGRCEQFEAENQCHISKQTFHMYQCAIFFKCWQMRSPTYVTLDI